jgi:hypothetical protein
VSSNELAAVTGATSTPAERMRSLLLAAGSLTLHTPGHRADLVGRHTVAAGRVTVELPIVSCMGRQVVNDGEVLAMIEVTDLAPVPVRDRVRARATLTGRLTPTDGGTRDGEVRAVLALATAELVTPGGAEPVEPGAFAAARSDPLAAAEAGLLGHLNDCHRDAIEQLSRLIPPHQMHDVRGVHPLRLDRHGIVLRLEYATQDRDVRLNFPVSLDGPNQVGIQIDALLAQVRGRP